MRMRNTLLAATMLAAPVLIAGAAKAQPIDGFYIGAGAGLNFRQNDNSKGLRVNTGNLPQGAVIGARTHNVYDLGFDGVLSVGYGFGNGFRLEGEGSYRQNDIRHFEGTSFPTVAKGSAKTYGAMGNLLYDFNFAALGLPFLDTYLPHPYIGGGVGYQWTDLGDITATNPGVPFGFASKGVNGQFAYQGIAGVAVPIEAVPGLALTAEYRFLGQAANTRFRTAVVSGPFAVAGKQSIGDQFNHSINIGVRYAFNQPEPAPQAAVIPAAPARSYLVFFDWDRADLTGRARQIIAQAAQSSTTVRYTAIEVNGYTDTSGTAAYNQRLSIRRAQTVAAELVRDGVPRQAIAIQGFGETRLLVPTAQGVREPQNRRVEIIIR